MGRRVLVVAVLAVLAAGCGGGDQAAEGLFAYDADRSLEIERGSHVPANDLVEVRELAYASGGDRVEAYLVAPRERGAHVPAVLFLHGAGGDRSEQLASAVELGERGALALTITVPSRRKSPPADAEPEDALRWQRDSIVADVVAARRALDLLESDDRVDGDRLGLVGWSMGARLASIVADVDRRARATVLISCGAVPVAEYVAAAPEQLQDDVQEVLPAIDPLSHIGA